MSKLMIYMTIIIVLIGCQAKEDTQDFSLSEISVFTQAGLEFTNAQAGSYDFGSTKLIDSGTKSQFIISNAGSENLTGITVGITGSDNADFILTDPIKETLLPGERTWFYIQFQPLSGGDKTAMVSINSSDQDENPFTFPITGTADTIPGIISISVFDKIYSDEVYLQWEKESWITNFNLYVSEDNTNHPILLWSGTNTSYRHTNLTETSTNYYRVDAVNSNQTSQGNYSMAITTPQKTTADPGQISIHTVDKILYSFDAEIYTKPTNELVVMTLNLHTYQESDQDSKLDKIAQYIAKLEVDLIAFQECAQHKNSPVLTNTIRTDNMALLIAERLNQYYGLDYYFSWDWSHIGFGYYEEGVAVLSRYPIEASEARYVSSSSTTSDINSRKVIFGRMNVSGHGYIHLISAHLHWRTSTTDEEQNNQIRNTKSMAAEMMTNYSYPELTLICGDFNGNPTSDFPWSEGYNTMMSNSNYIDTFLEYHPNANNTPAQSQYDTVKGDFPGRIDYIFMSTNSQYEVITSQILFTPDIVGTVSDHYGVVTRIRK